MISSTSSSFSRNGNISTNGNTTNNSNKKGNKNGNKGIKLSTDPQSVAARERRHRISDRFKMLQCLVPGGAKLDTVSMLDQTIEYVKFLKSQIWLHQSIINHSTYNNNNNNNSSSSDNNNNYDQLNDNNTYYDDYEFYDQYCYAKMYDNCNYGETCDDQGDGGYGGGLLETQFDGGDSNIEPWK